MTSSRLSQQDQSLLDDFENDDSDRDDDLLGLGPRFAFSQQSAGAASEASSLSAASSAATSSNEQRKEKQQQQQQQQLQPRSSTSPSLTAAIDITTAAAASADVVDDDHHTDNHDVLAMTTTAATSPGDSSTSTSFSNSNGGDNIFNNAAVDTEKSQEEEVVVVMMREEDLNIKAAKKAMYASMDQVKNVSHVSKLRWHVIKKTKYYPCVIRHNDHQQSAFFAKHLKVHQLNKQKPILIEYLGFRDRVSTGKLAAASKSSLLPYDYDFNNTNANNNNTKTDKATFPDDDNKDESPAVPPTATTTAATATETAAAAAAAASSTLVVVEWSPTLMASYEKLLKSQSSFAAGGGANNDVHVKARAEVMALNRMLQHVVQRQQQQQQQQQQQEITRSAFAAAAAATFSLTQQQPSEEEEEEEDDDDELLQDDSEMMQSENDEPLQQDKSSPSTDVAAAAAAPPPPPPPVSTIQDVNALRAGDVIDYFALGATACPESRRRAQIVAAFPGGCGDGSNISLHLDDGTMLDRDEKILLVKRYLRKQLKWVNKPKWRYINACKVSKENNDQFAQARNEVLYRGANQIKALQQEAKREEEVFWQQRIIPAESNSKAAAGGAATNSGDDINDNATSNDRDVPIHPPQKQSKHDHSKEKCTQKENAGGQAEVCNVSAKTAGKQRRRHSNVTADRDCATTRTTDNCSANQSKRQRKALDEEGGTTLPVKEQKRVESSTLSMAKNDKKKQNGKKKREISWKDKLHALLDAVRVKRNKSRYDRELVQAQEDNLTTALAVCSHLESSSASSTTPTPPCPFGILLERNQAVMDEIADDCDVPPDRLVDYLQGNQRNLINQTNVVKLSESLKLWLEKETQKVDDLPPLVKQTTHVENPLQSSGVVVPSSFHEKEDAVPGGITSSSPPIDHHTTQPESTTRPKTTRSHVENADIKFSQDSAKDTSGCVVKESPSLPAEEKRGTESVVQPLNHDAITQMRQLAVQTYEATTTHNDPVEFQREMPCPTTTDFSPRDESNTSIPVAPS